MRRWILAALIGAVLTIAHACSLLNISIEHSTHTKIKGGACNKPDDEPDERCDDVREHEAP
jgi:hypothetical protein